MMKRFSMPLLTGLFAACLVVFGVVAVVRAQSDSELTEEKIEMIQGRCSSSQLALQQIEKRDAVSRINRGRAYDQLLRQVSAFNSRFAYNKINEPELVQITTDLQSAIDKFRAAYDRYDTDMADAVKVDCKTKPTDYYNVILKARQDRSTVGDEVNAIADLMARYREAIVTYQEGLQ